MNLAKLSKLAVLAGLLMFPVSLFAGEASAPQFQNGDRICFIGDSITHGGSYHLQVLLYYATRFPERKLEAWNCGISGDMARGAVRRYDWDIRPHKPTVATIMLGMNDVGRNLYDGDKKDDATEKARQAALTNYRENMLKLSQMLADAGCRIIYITPSIYDQTGTQAAYNWLGVNDALGLCAQDCRALEEQFHGGLVDVYGLMSRINAEQQKLNPAFTIVGGDRVHPGVEGHLVMAYAILKAQGVPAVVADMAVDAGRAQILKQDNCAVSELKAENGAISFVCREKSLPFPLMEGQRKKVEPLVPFTDELNREMLTVAGLAPGNYTLLIDGQPVQDGTAAELAAGINLANNPKTPQSKQAAKVAGLFWKRQPLEASQLRTIAAVRHGVLAKANVKPGDAEAEQKALQAELERCRAAKFAYGATQVETYLKYAGDREKIEAEAADLWKAVYAANQPVPHRFEIRPK